MATQPCILVVDDDVDIRDSLFRLLNTEGFKGLTAADGDEMFNKLAEEKVDIILLDLMLPGLDGFDLCRQLRADPATPPVLMITAKDQEIDRVVGLELGADDYIVKPFSSRELIARIKVVLRRVKITGTRLNKGLYIFSGWSFNPSRMELIDQNSVVLPLSTSENNLLLAFVQNPKVPLSRDRLLDLTKGGNISPLDRSIDSHVSRLRRKLGDNAKHPEIIKTAWGKGYIFTYEVELV
jgi:two-component system OmpR family response regulator